MRLYSKILLTVLISLLVFAGCSDRSEILSSDPVVYDSLTIQLTTFADSSQTGSGTLATLEANGGSGDYTYSFIFGTEHDTVSEFTTQYYEFQNAGSHEIIGTVIDTITYDTVSVTKTVNRYDAVPEEPRIEFLYFAPQTGVDSLITTGFAQVKGEIERISWRLSDGQSLILKNPSFHISTLGETNVACYVKFTDGTSDTASTTLFVFESEPEEMELIYINAIPHIAYVGEPVQFSAIPFGSKGTLYQEWNVDGQLIGFGSNTSHTFNDTGIYIVHYQAKDDFTVIDTTVRVEVYLKDPPPVLRSFDHVVTPGIAQLPNVNIHLDISVEGDDSTTLVWTDIYFNDSTAYLLNMKGRTEDYTITKAGTYRFISYAKWTDGEVLSDTTYVSVWGPYVPEAITWNRCTDLLVTPTAPNKSEVLDIDSAMDYRTYFKVVSLELINPVTANFALTNPNSPVSGLVFYIPTPVYTADTFWVDMGDRYWKTTQIISLNWVSNSSVDSKTDVGIKALCHPRLRVIEVMGTTDSDKRPSGAPIYIGNTTEVTIENKSLIN